ncbi:dATP/dGTP pyrophosphohydrolase domain-containing protein [Klebsiella quasipneumoniae]|uniref:dATP/dGTP pyrophosphohydrolase domain-containing protein n=1 Tax=Klebsiella quasipneumoniae TaxID=1463165 RepID=UPI0035C871CD
MTKSTITRELVHWLHDAATEFASTKLKMTMKPDEVLALTGALLASMDTEPVGWTDEQELRDVDRGGCGYLFTVNPVTPHADERRIILLYRHAQPAPERDQVRSAHAEWSQATFGNVGPVGPLKHLSKEALEAAAEPGDLSEWADMQFLLWDAQRRAGITDDQVTQAMIDKLAVNKQREWPAPKDGEPRLHIKEQPAPIASVCTCPSGDGSLRWPCPVHPGNSPAQSYCCPAQNSVSPAQNQGWIPVSERMPEDEQEVLTINKMGHRFVSFFDKHSGLFFDRLDAPAACCIEHVLVTHWMPLPAAPQEVKGE